MANKPKLEFQTNIPKTLILKQKAFKVTTDQNHPEWGKSFWYNFVYKDVEHIYFAKQAFHNMMVPFDEGTELTITYKEQKGEAGIYHDWVAQATGGENEAVPTGMAVVDIDLEIAEAVDLYMKVLAAVAAAMRRYITDFPAFKDYVTSETMQKDRTTIFIELSRRLHR